jgi:hypothetical protein
LTTFTSGALTTSGRTRQGSDLLMIGEMSALCLPRLT